MTTLQWNGQALSQARLRKGLSQEQLARGAGTTANHVSRCERNVHTPSAELLHRLAAECDVTTGEFFDVTDEDEDDLLAALKKALPKGTAEELYEAVLAKLEGRVRT